MGLLVYGEGVSGQTTPPIALCWGDPSLPGCILPILLRSVCVTLLLEKLPTSPDFPNLQKECPQIARKAPSSPRAAGTLIIHFQ